MGIELDLSSLVPFVVDLSQGTATISNINSLAARIVAKVVGVIAEIEGLERGIRTSIKYPDASILRIRNVQPIASRHIKDALRFLQAADRLYSFAYLDIDNFHGVVTRAETKRRCPFTSTDR